MMEGDGIAGRREVALQIGYPQWSKGGDDAFCAIAIRVSTTTCRRCAAATSSMSW